MPPCPSCAEATPAGAASCPHCGSALPAAPAAPAGAPAVARSSSKSGLWIVLGIVGATVLTGICVCGILGSMLLPAVQQAREAARRSACKNNLKQIGLALHNYHETYGSLPPAYIPDENGRPMHSWRVLILPFIDQAPLHEMYDFNQPWDSPANLAVLEMIPEVYRCPSATVGSTTTHYAAISGTGSAFNGADPVRFRDFKDGQSQTILIGEAHDAAIPWTAPRDLDISAFGGIATPTGFSSSHPGGVHVLFGDGSVQFIAESITTSTLDALLTIDGREALVDF